jgi:formylglycine-generating enzyme required for sulfatase activity/predicted Ser/Thr protein kinase
MAEKQSTGKIALYCKRCDRNYGVEDYRSSKNYNCPGCSEALATKAQFEGTVVSELQDALPEDLHEAVIDPNRRVGRFVLVGILGRGGMGVVHKGWDVELDRYVAIKFLSAKMKEEQLARFKREARLVAQLDHPNIAAVHDVGEHQGRRFIVMRYVDGVTLDEARIKDERRLVEVMAQACKGVGHAHVRGIVHRDLKPNNVMLDWEGRVFVMDFGLAKDFIGAQGPHHTSNDTLIGTPAFMAPEQARGESNAVDARSDVFSLGATLWSLLAGRAPHTGEAALEILHNVGTKGVPSIDTVKPDVSKELQAVVTKATAFEKADRYANAAEMGKALEQVLGEPPRQRPPAQPESRPAPRAQERSFSRFSGRKELIIGGAALAAVVLGLVVAINLGRDTTPPKGSSTGDGRTTASSTPDGTAPNSSKPAALLTVDLGGGVSMDFVYIKPGTFTMGATEGANDSFEGDPRPQHPVTITQGFYMGKYEVTKRQFAAFVKETSHQTEAEKEGKSWGRTADGRWSEIPGVNWKNPVAFNQTDDDPVICVSWNDANAFCKWLSKQTECSADLPTEAEWEYACRAGTRTSWSYGDEEGELGEYAQFYGNSNQQTHPVGQKKANPWGLYDMHGNVWEWTADWAGPYTAEPATDPTGPTAGEKKVLRGGSWHEGPRTSRAAFRRVIDGPASRSEHTGFRVVLR